MVGRRHEREGREGAIEEERGGRVDAIKIEMETQSGTRNKIVTQHLR